MKKFIKIFLVLLLTVIIILLYYCLFIYHVPKNSIPIVDNPINKENAENVTQDTNPYVIDEDVDFEIIPIYKEEKKSNEIVNILLAGMDARNYNEKSRSDSIILVSYNKSKKTIKLVSFMRDSYVNIPGKHWAKINAATAYGGVGLLINTINETFDLDIQNYIEVKFDDFKEIIDALGGIDINLSKNEVQYINNKQHIEDKNYKDDLEYSEDKIHLNGTQTLWHCRNRSIGNSDFERTERQREVLTAIIEKALKMDLPTAVTTITTLIDHTETNLPINLMIDIAKNALIDKNLTIETSRIPYEGMYREARINGASVLKIDIEKNTKKLHEFLGYEPSEVN